MNIHKNIKVAKEILASIDFNNTVFGGSVEPQLNISENESAFELALRIPGLSEKALKIEVIDDNLWLYQLMPVLSNNTQQGFMPKNYSQLALAGNIDKENIEAHFENGAWLITLPKDNSKKGFRKSII